MKTVKHQFIRVANSPTTSVLVSLPLGLVPVYLSPQEEAYGGDSMDKLGLDGIKEAYNFQPNEGKM
jgi:hypothetical protein